ncbi:MAG: hypothetical protein KJZ74_02360 [Gemmatimonadales bacterium]|nr:hypothetical protein [Gemmatimonadales bacterium]
MPATNWIFYPQSTQVPLFLREVVRVFEEAESDLVNRSREMKSDQVLARVRSGLVELGFAVEVGKKAAEKIRVPVLFGRNGSVSKAFDADAWHKEQRVVLEVEAGRGYLNNQFLKDLFQACMMHDVDYCVIAVRNLYIESRDFESVAAFFETLYTSGRLELPLKGVLLLGYGASR